MLYLPIVSAEEFGFSPSSLEFESSEKDNCEDIWLFSDKRVTIHIEDLWSDFPSIKIGDYVNHKKFINYTNRVVVDGKESITICKTRNDGKKHYGLLIFNLEESSISGGMWVRLGDRESMVSPLASLSHIPSDESLIVLKGLQTRGFPIGHLYSVILIELAVILCSILPILLLASCKRKLFGYRRGDPKTFIYSL